VRRLVLKKLCHGLARVKSLAGVERRLGVVFLVAGCRAGRQHYGEHRDLRAARARAPRQHWRPRPRGALTALQTPVCVDS
jgi:hypothetical protein